MLGKEQRAQKRLLQKSGQIIAASKVAVLHAAACRAKIDLSSGFYIQLLFGQTLAQIYQILLLWCYRVGMFRETVNLYCERCFLNLPSLFLILLG